MVGHMKHIEDIVDHIAMAGPLTTSGAFSHTGPMILNQAKAWLSGDPLRAERYLGDRGVVALVLLAGVT